MVTWDVKTSFAKLVKMPIEAIDVNVLTQTRAGISRQIRNTKSATKSKKLRLIRDQIDSLIDRL